MLVHRASLWIRERELVGPGRSTYCAAVGISDTPRGQFCVPLGSARVPAPALILACSDCVDKRPPWPLLPCRAHTCLWWQEQVYSWDWEAISLKTRHVTTHRQCARAGLTARVCVKVAV